MELVSLNSWYDNSFSTLKRIPEKCFMNRIELWWVSILYKKPIKYYTNQMFCSLNVHAS